MASSFFIMFSMLFKSTKMWQMCNYCRQQHAKQKSIGIILLLLNTNSVFFLVSDPLYTSHLDFLILTWLKERLLSCQNTSCINDLSSFANGTHFRQWKLMKENKSCQRHCFSRLHEYVRACLRGFKKSPGPLWWKGQAKKKREKERYKERFKAQT